MGTLTICVAEQSSEQCCIHGRPLRVVSGRSMQIGSQSLTVVLTLTPEGRLVSVTGPYIPSLDTSEWFSDGQSDIGLSTVRLP